MKIYSSSWDMKKPPRGGESSLFGISENGLDDFPDMPYHTQFKSPDKVKIIRILTGRYFFRGIVY
jgi:hypothetical protein